LAYIKNNASKLVEGMVFSASMSGKEAGSGKSCVSEGNSLKEVEVMRNRLIFNPGRIFNPARICGLTRATDVISAAVSLHSERRNRAWRAYCGRIGARSAIGLISLTVYG
jgi:hypothetical protein